MKQASKEAVIAANIKLKKSLGQNFLKDFNLIKKIVSLVKKEENISIIEIGPGIGALTEELITNFEQVIVIEIDQRLIPILEDKFNDKIEIINEDFLQIDINLLKKKIKNDNIKVIANIPYYITTPIIMRILNEMKFVNEIIIMVQKELAERICAKEKTKQYNSLSVFCQTISDANIEMIIKKESFVPMPKIDSAILRFKPKELDIDRNDYSKFLQACFVQKRKTLVNCLNQVYKIDKKDLELFLEKNDIKINIRAEEIAIKEYLFLYYQFKNEFLKKEE